MEEPWDCTLVDVAGDALELRRLLLGAPEESSAPRTLVDPCRQTSELTVDVWRLRVDQSIFSLPVRAAVLQTLPASELDVPAEEASSALAAPPSMAGERGVSGEEADV